MKYQTITSSRIISHHLASYRIMSISEFQQLRCYARDTLVKFRDGDKFDNHTGIEETLVQPYLDQIIKLHDWMILDFSTNYPANPYFQSMSISGIIPITKKKQFIKCLNMLDVSYSVDNIRKTSPLLPKRLLVQSLYSRVTGWSFNKKYGYLVNKIKKLNLKYPEQLSSKDTLVFNKIYIMYPELSEIFCTTTTKPFQFQSIHPAFANLDQDQYIYFEIIANKPFERTLYQELANTFTSQEF